ncbi:MAG: FAD:protein FMN transferase [Cyclobacteriaceae bacterium]|nr:FAD:protein FMN transferase [Cyclobacteriaceae bacterium]
MNTVANTECRRNVKLMGSDFEFTVLQDEEDGYKIVDEAIQEVKRIENLLTEFTETSQTSLINRNAGIKAVVVDDEVYALIRRCKEIALLTQGAFDITAAGLRKLYNFKRGNADMPNTDQLKAALARIGSEKILLKDGKQVYLSQPGMHIGFGGIGKGYAADAVKKILLQRGVKSAVINASGDLTAFGLRADGSLWKVGIADPRDPARIMAWIPVQNASVATSGDYEQYFERNGIRYGHTIDPKTGYPVTGIKSVTIVSASAELSDAIATAVTIMGVEVGLHFIEQLPGVHGLIINDHNKIFTSQHLRLNMNTLP